MLENGTHATIAEIAAAEKINESFSALAIGDNPARYVKATKVDDLLGRS